MSQYVDKSLADNETILMRGRWPTLFWVGAWLALVLLGIAIVGVVLFIWAASVMMTTEFAVTDKRVVLKRGFFTRRTQEFSVTNVEGVKLTQSVWGRIFGFGRVIVSGTGTDDIVFPPMADPIDFRRAIENARSLGREVHIAEEQVERIATTTPVHEPRGRDEVQPRAKKRRRSFVGLMR